MNLDKTHCYFDLTGTSHIMHSLDLEVDSANWNLPGHTIDVLCYTQQDCMVEPMLQWIFSPMRLSGQKNRCSSAMSPLRGKCLGEEDLMLGTLSYGCLWRWAVAR